ncbi:hypothetical protein JGH11_08425 [Dysgonomonas sp. Marseille-P4677]|uniref:tetratricopeptide repeat protein n=1 Tax=Dysgonomonas sp. Marseille-P4677 TaxID=2364790 RepID=UPI001912880F|nr:hypothetical protein [Dysgonomonas sp. Marseille-P4677]MBK5720894.1 hypothetical protein [Dysgonomonas sp. Marseille-P4677]
MKYYSIPIVFILLFISCKKEKDETNPTSQNIEKLINQNPNNALILLESYHIDPKDEYNYCKYLLYKVQVKDRSNKSIVADLVILDVYNYFKENQVNPYTGLSAYYSGRVLQKNKLFDKALDYYRYAESYAKEHDIKYLQALSLYSIAEIMLNQDHFEDAKELLSEASSLFTDIKEHKYEIKTNTLLGRYFRISQQYDSALFHYNKGLDLALKHQNKKEEALILRGKGIVYNEQGEYKKAITYFKDAAMLDSVVFESGRILLNIATSYLNMAKIDSARHYADLSLKFAEKETPPSLSKISDIYNILSQIEEKSGNNTKALEYHKMYSSFLIGKMKEKKGNARTNTEKKHQFEEMRNENIALARKKVIIERILYLTLLVVTISFLVYNRRLLSKTKQLSKAYGEIQKLNNEIITLTADLKEYYARKEFMRNNLINNYKILKRAAYLEHLIQDTENKQGKALIKMFNEIAYGKDTPDWEVLYQVLNTVHYGIFDKIKEAYPNLDDIEFKICCLIYSQFNSSEISVVIQLSVNTVHTKTTSVRKKLGVEKYGNITEFINRNFTSIE